MQKVSCEKCGHEITNMALSPEAEDASELILQALILDLRQQSARIDVLIAEADKAADVAELADLEVEERKADREVFRLRGLKEGLSKALQTAASIVCDVLRVELRVVDEPTAPAPSEVRPDGDVSK